MVTAAHPSIAKKLGLQKPSPLEKVPRNEADEVSRHKSNKKPPFGGRWHEPASDGGSCGTKGKDVLRMKHINPSARDLPHPRSSGAPSRKEPFGIFVPQLRVVEGADPYRQDRNSRFGNGRKYIL